MSCRSVRWLLHFFSLEFWFVGQTSDKTQQGGCYLPAICNISPCVCVVPITASSTASQLPGMLFSRWENSNKPYIRKNKQTNKKTSRMRSLALHSVPACPWVDNTTGQDTAIHLFHGVLTYGTLHQSQSHEKLVGTHTKSSATYTKKKMGYWIYSISFYQVAAQNDLDPEMFLSKCIVSL